MRRPTVDNGEAPWISRETPTRDPLDDLENLERALGQVGWSGGRDGARTRRRALERARDALRANGRCTAGDRTPLVRAAAEMLDAVKADLASKPGQTADLIAELEAIGVPRVALAREVFRAPDLISMPPSAAVEVQLGMLVAFSALRSASLWTQNEAEGVTCLAHVGEGGPTRGAKLLSRRLLAGEELDDDPRRQLFGVSIGRWHLPVAALVGSARPGERDDAMHIIAEAVPMLTAILERGALLAGNAASERALVESSERKLTRLGFDIHDGPIQNIVVLAQDLRLFQGQLEQFLPRRADYTRVRGRMEDFDAQLAALEAQLRRLSSEIHAPVLLNRPFDVALRDVVETFATRTGVEPRLALDGDTTTLSASQQIALLNVIHESLTNIRSHSNATEVEIAVSINSQGAEARVTDNGRGFDVEKTLIRAARKGRFGLVAIHERVRLLGGRCHIDSRPGGPTTVTVALDRWEPIVEPAIARRVTA
jgi:signal transduction histidine kinase